MGFFKPTDEELKIITEIALMHIQSEDTKTIRLLWKKLEKLHGGRITTLQLTIERPYRKYSRKGH